MKPDVTIKDVARLAGVSPITVSRVLNNSTNAREETRKRVLEAVKKLDYHPNRSARSLATRKSGFLGVIIPQKADYVFENPFHTLVLKGISQVAESYEYRVLITTAARDNSYIQMFREKWIDGAILMSVSRFDTGVIQLYHEQVPFVMTCPFLEGFDVHWVDVDNFQGALDAVRYLVETGHRRIAMINGPSTLVSCRLRHQAYKAVLDERGIRYDPSLVVEADFTEAAGYDKMQELLRREPRPDAVFVAADVAAIGAIQAARQTGLMVPEDISVIGFDGLPLGQYIDPPLTTVLQPAYEKGVKAAEMLLKILGDEKLDIPQVKLPAQLVIRKSVKQR
ncbi:MAG: LacI family DNA-binding transcriptional regulator [Bacillota bacterium]